MAIKTFTDFTSLPASDINTFLANAGLVYVNSQTVTAGVSSIAITGFSSTYDSYRIVLNNGTLAGLAVIGAQMTGSTASYYGALANIAVGTNLSAPVSNNNASSWSIVGVGNASFASLAFDLHDPFLARPTRVGTSNYVSTTDAGTYNGLHNVSTSYSSITISTGSTFQTGTITVYGYRKA
jgi:hypothetical protein